MTNLSDTLLVSISFSDKDTGVLVVGRKERINLLISSTRFKEKRHLTFTRNL